MLSNHGELLVHELFRLGFANVYRPIIERFTRQANNFRFRNNVQPELLIDQGSSGFRQVPGNKVDRKCVF